MDSYFLKARDWYVSKYQSAGVQLIYSIVMCIIVASCVIAALEEITIDSTHYKMPIAVYTNDQINYYTNIKSISNKGEDINISVARYLIQKYVINREEYKYGFLSASERGDKIMTIRRNSSRRVFDQYINYLNPTTNIDSPILKYGYNVERVIENINVSFAYGVKRPDYAVVQFNIREISSTSEQVETWKAIVKFSMSDIMNIIDNNTALNFVVTGYELAAM
ncbi:Type IV secretion system protein VirB8 [Candidatus Cyrtobacter comes]|uniref:Type IV secretion system protein VirB8 n=1 Tax=Candidatus Cyrtobacter comes TaxID=675776 RepID=A0ABU5L7W7_9RICK|nr:VirB8/TrbF family protein [Candidatus Cyrtobacter comes]MDZ5762208.1 Type IV secretion system protein VirB8 [Candidatus Cyrtobacter comes]